jgi:hypothetical protein
MDYLVNEYESYLERIGDTDEPCPTCGLPTDKDFCSGQCFEAYLI